MALFFLDLLVDETVVVELKAFSHLLTNDEIAQVINYLVATELPVGLLKNFGQKKLEFRRVFPPKNVEPWIGRAGRYNVRKTVLPSANDQASTRQPSTNEENEFVFFIR